MLLNALGYIDFTMNLNKSLMWHVLIGWCIPKGLHPILIEFNFKNKKKINSMIWQCIFFGAKISSSKLLINIIIECEQK